MDYIMHFLTLFWKLIFAFIPPTGNTSRIIHSLRHSSVVQLDDTRLHFKFQCLFSHLDPLLLRLDLMGGYLCFVVSILSIGVVTAIIGDVASHFGCTLGIKDSVTAIVFVALGTSIPGTVHLKTTRQNRFSEFLPRRDPSRYVRK